MPPPSSSCCSAGLWWSLQQDCWGYNEAKTGWCRIHQDKYLPNDYRYALWRRWRSNRLQNCYCMLWLGAGCAGTLVYFRHQLSPHWRLFLPTKISPYQYFPLQYCTVCCHVTSNSPHRRTDQIFFIPEFYTSNTSLNGVRCRFRNHSLTINKLWLIRS